MSADNWARCPRCDDRAVKAHKEAMDVIRAKYGKVSADEWDKLRATITEKHGADTETFREDYEVGIWGGKFNVTYRGHCSVCGLKHEFDRSEPITGYEVPA